MMKRNPALGHTLTLIERIPGEDETLPEQFRVLSMLSFLQEHSKLSLVGIALWWMCKL